MPVGVGIGGAVLGAGTSLINGSNASDAAAANTAAQQQANQAALAEQQREFNTQQDNLAPWLAAGSSALGAQSNLLGLNGNDAQGSAISALQSSPLYTSQYNTGLNTVLNNAAATGGLRGGNATNSLYNVGQQTLASTIQQQLANLAGVSGTGQSSATSLNGSGANSANVISQLLQQQGQVTGGGILNQAAAGNATNTGVASSLNNLLNNSAFMSALNGGAGSSFSAGNSALNASNLSQLGLNYDVGQTIANNGSIF